MLHRVFLAINLPDDVKRRLADFQKNWPTLPIRWTKPENLHITLVFLGNLDDNQLNETIKKAREVVEGYRPFVVNLGRICYGPQHLGAGDQSAGRKIPKMVWVEGRASQELARLQRSLEDSIFNIPSYKYKEREVRPYHCHITLGRLRQWEFRRLEEKPEIDEQIDLSFEANSLEVMESQLKKGGPEYTILESAEFLK